VNGHLPPWVLQLVRAIQDSEDVHPQYMMDSALLGIIPLDQCPEARFLALVPADVRRAAGGGY